MKRAARLLATYASAPWKAPPRRGIGRHNKMRSKPSDNTPWYDKGLVEWIPRPVRITTSTLDDLRDWVMRQTLDGKVDEIQKVRDLHREWSHHPMRPVLGDVEPKLPKNIYKRNHRAYRLFKYRWHKANSPNNWAWLPRTGVPPHLRTHAVDYPENWKAMRDAQKLRSV